jgi:uncharacterized protein (TIGR03084 family)
MPDISELISDLDAESGAVDALVATLPAVAWDLATPADGWTIAHQISHLAWTDQVAYLSVTDAISFNTALAHAADDPAGFVDHAAIEGLAPPTELLARWRAGRTALTSALSTSPQDIKLPWYGVAMSPASMATGRIMETWAHGTDIADALGVTMPATTRLRHVLFLATRTFGFSFSAHGLPTPDAPVRLELVAPDGSLWTYGPDDADDRIQGTALDFGLVATHRRHRDDVDLRTTGPVADAWLDVVQTFAGPPGQPRRRQTEQPQPTGAST